ncbi:MAG: DUF1156 domain-containing protein, partial [Planctomycetaceae bacterium]|nr:DUF1156 domain-containing protein [Planctomycetaceae bacterium]
MKRLIETDLPIKRISAHSRREKSIRHGHISTLHIWWARRPLAACRAVLLATILPDPMDAECPDEFRKEALEIMRDFAKQILENKDIRNSLPEESVKIWDEFNRRQKPAALNLQQALLDFIADYANWDCSAIPLFIETGQKLTQRAAGFVGADDEQFLVADPFAGGGSIPLEALRLGCDAFASDLNPVAVTLNKVVLEYIPKYGQQLADAVRHYGNVIKEKAEKELAQFYPAGEQASRLKNDSAGTAGVPYTETPIAYIWARTIQCEGPGCGAEVPLMRSLYLAKKDKRQIGLKLLPRKDKSGVDFTIIDSPNPSESGKFATGTVARANAVCPCCGYTTKAERVRTQLKARRGGADDARLVCVVTTHSNEQGRFYRLPNETDYNAIENAKRELKKRNVDLPNEETPKGGGRGAGRAFSQRNYGMDKFSDLFTSRQLLSLTTLSKLVRELEI